MFRNVSYAGETDHDLRDRWGRCRVAGVGALARLVATALAGLFAIALPGCALSTTGAARAGRGLELLTEPGSIAPIYAAIDGARTSVDMTMYELEDPTAEQALAAAARRGVTVRVLLNGGAERGANAAAFDYLRAHGVQVRWSPPYFARTHQKTISIDHRRSLVMTLNLTARYYAATRDFALWDGRLADVAAIEAVFDADWGGRVVIPSPGSGDLVWSPGAERGLLAFIEGARSSLYVENEEMADQIIIDALCRAARRRVRVRVVMSYQSEWSGAFATLASCDVSVRLYHGETPIYIHAKAIVADDTSAYVGSQNFSYYGLERNRELGLITTSRAVIRSLAHTFNGDYRGAARG